MNKTLKLLNIILVITGIGLIIYGIYTKKDYCLKRLTLESIPAEVKGYQYDNKGLRAVIVEYHIGDNSYTISSNNYKKNPLNKGDLINVEYNTQNPDEAIIQEDTYQLKTSIVGVVLILVAIASSIIKKLVHKLSKSLATVPSNKSTQTETFQETPNVKVDTPVEVFNL